MLRLTYRTLDYSFRTPFKMAKGSKTKQPALLLSLSFKQLRGFGETTEIAYYHNAVLDFAKLLEKHRSVIERYSMNDPARFWHFLHHLVKGHNFLIAALDVAGWDLWAKIHQTTVRSLMDIPKLPQTAPTNYSIGLNIPEKVVEEVTQHPWPIYKLRMGDEFDKERLEVVKKVAPDARLRLDANEAWSLDQAESLLDTIEDSNVEFIEQPFNRTATDDLKQFKSLTDIPIIADEACKDEKDLIRCLGHYDGINIKLSKVGGLTPALRMIKTIKKSDKKVALGNMFEGNIMSTATAQLIPLADYVDIDGPLLLEESPGVGLEYKDGKIKIPFGPGLGLEFP